MRRISNYRDLPLWSRWLRPFWYCSRVLSSSCRDTESIHSSKTEDASPNTEATWRKQEMCRHRKQQNSELQPEVRSKLPKVIVTLYVHSLPVGKIGEEGTFQVWTETTTSRCKVLHHMWRQTLSGKHSEKSIKLSLYKHLKSTMTDLNKQSQLQDFRQRL